MEILNVRIDPLRRHEVGEQLRYFLETSHQHFIATPNAEMLVAAFHNPSFQTILNQSSLNTCDSMGVWLASRCLGKPIPERITGVEMVTLLCEIAAQKKTKVFFLGGKEGSAAAAAEHIRQKIPDLQITTSQGGKIERAEDGSWRMSSDILSEIRETAPEILMVALGHRKQEAWIHDHLPLLPGVKIAIGVGGALDYLAGKAKFPPPLVRSWGFEWLWRLAHEPWRLPRIFKAVIVFPFLVFRSKWSKRLSD